MPNLLDLMTEEDKATVKRWAEERKNPKYKTDIPHPYYTMAQLGYYYGWEAVVDARRGYHVGVDKNGKLIRLAFELEEAIALIKAAEKVHYKLKLDEGHINAAKHFSTYDKEYSKKQAEYVNKIADSVED